MKKEKVEELMGRCPGLFYHKITDEETLKDMEDIRAAVITLGVELLSLSESRAKSLAFTALEEMSMRAIQSIAIHTGVLQIPQSLEIEL